MQQVGIVIEKRDGSAVVQIMRVSACGENCAMCGGCTPTRQRAVANNQIGAKVGSRVRIELSDEKVLLAAFLVYIVPIFTLIAGYAVFGAFGGFVGFALPFLLLKILDKRLIKRYTANITKILEE